MTSYLTIHDFLSWTSKHKLVYSTIRHYNLAYSDPIESFKPFYRGGVRVDLPAPNSKPNTKACI